MAIDGGSALSADSEISRYFGNLDANTVTFLGYVSDIYVLCIPFHLFSVYFFIFLITSSIKTGVLHIIFQETS